MDSRISLTIEGRKYGLRFDPEQFESEEACADRVSSAIREAILSALVDDESQVLWVPPYGEIPKWVDSNG